jgi:hypothetical protein
LVGASPSIRAIELVSRSPSPESNRSATAARSTHRDRRSQGRTTPKIAISPTTATHKPQVAHRIAIGNDQAKSAAMLAAARIDATRRTLPRPRAEAEDRSRTSTFRKARRIGRGRVVGGMAWIIGRLLRGDLASRRDLRDSA